MGKLDNDIERVLHELQARVGQLEDERDIRELLSRYGFLADMGLDEAYVNLYAEDGAINIGTVRKDNAGYEDIVRFEGHDDLMRFITDPAAHKAIEGRCMHLQGNNMRIQVDSDTAVAESYSLVLFRDGQDTIIRSAGVNRWTLVRHDDGWRIKERLRRAIGGEEFESVLVTRS